MTSKNFERLYKQLNPRQRQAVDVIEGPVMVVAGPGTGKTQMLTLRIANILCKTDTPPDAILALAFTEAAAATMRERLVSIIGPAGYRVGIFTFHGFCNDVIKRFPEEFPRIIGSTNITDVEKIMILKELISKTKLKVLKPFGSPYYYLPAVREKISELKRENINSKKLELRIKKNKEKKQKNKEFLKLFRAYEKTLRARRLYDYEDMIVEVIQALEKKKELLLRLQEECQYILADEHQDANNAQNRLLELLSSFHKTPNLFVVGDEKQAIFRFQGASLENFFYFQKRFPEAKVIRLEENYRSSQTILDAAGSGLKAKANHPAVKIRLGAFGKPEEEILFLAKDIKEKLKQGIVGEEIAVLYRDNRDVEPVVRIFEKEGVPFVIESDQNVLADSDIKKLLLLIRMVNNFGNDELLAEVLHIDFLEFGSMKIYKFLAEAKEKHMRLFDLLAAKKEKSFRWLFQLLSSWEAFSYNHSLVEFFELVARESGFLSAIIASSEPVEKLEKLTGLYDELGALVERHRNFKLKDFVAYLDLLLEHNVLVKKDRRGEASGRARLMTAHRAKGQEFDYIYIIGATDGHWGNRRNVKHFEIGAQLKSGKELDDERRLFYVALTRARKGVTIIYSKESAEGRMQLPSQFVEEIDKKFIATITPITFNTSETSFAQKKVKGISLSDKKYLSDLFLKQGFSVTALNNYLECPWLYFYSNLIRIPIAPSRHLMFGNAVHVALKQFFDAWRESKNLGKKNLLAIFEKTLRGQPFSENEFEDALEKGKKALAGYHDFYKGKWSRNILNEFKIKGVNFNIGDKEVVLTGKLDKVEILDSANHVNVVDYKTGKPKSRNAIVKASYHRQLVFYKSLLDLFDSGKYKMISGEIDFVEPNDKGKYRKEKFEISDDEVESLRKLIKRVANEIFGLKFWNKTCDKKDCRFCKLREMLK